MSKPRLVILDEPTNGLDIEGVVHIRETVKEMAEKEGVTFLIAGHIAAELENVHQGGGNQRGQTHCL